MHDDDDDDDDMCMMMMMMVMICVCYDDVCVCVLRKIITWMVMMMLVVGGNVWLLNVGGLQHQHQEQLTKLR